MKYRKIEVPYDQIDPETLKDLVEAYITRDGTFYGEKEMSMDQKIDMVISQLKSGEATLTWDLELQSGDIVLRKDKL